MFLVSKYLTAAVTLKEHNYLLLFFFNTGFKSGIVFAIDTQKV